MNEWDGVGGSSGVATVSPQASPAASALPDPSSTASGSGNPAGTGSDVVPSAPTTAGGTLTVPSDRAPSAGDGTGGTASGAAGETGAPTNPDAASGSASGGGGGGSNLGAAGAASGAGAANGVGSGGAANDDDPGLGGSALSDAYPCDGSTDGYDVVVEGEGNEWTVSGAGSFNDLASALGAAYGALSPGRTDKESILVLGDGSIDASAQLKMPSDMVLNVCGTIDVTGTASGSDRSPLYARDRSNIDIPHVRLTGNAQYGIFLRDVSNIHLGEVILEMNVENSGLGIRIDNNAGGFDRISNITLDSVYVAGTAGHGVETYGVQGLHIGRVEGLDTGDCGLILNNTYDATVGSVRCNNCAHIGTGYAAFRVANDNGNDGSGSFPAGNIHVGEVYARGGGRGVFSVSGSGGLVIDRIDIADTGNDAILLQNCYNTVIAAESGTVRNGNIILSNDTDNTNSGRYAPSSDVLLSNLTLENASITEAWCDLGDLGNRAENISGGTVNMCFE